MGEAKKIRLPPGGKYLSGGVLYEPGDVLPDTPETRGLVRRGRAVLEADEGRKRRRRQ
ncbi:MAG: hypothetical protein LBC93_08300 [Synergistaceae bacterium]|jgi:hypothetical protein|nr:hypothetical protein [Synergistaceae bacterium]